MSSSDPVWYKCDYCGMTQKDNAVCQYDKETDVPLFEYHNEDDWFEGCSHYCEAVCPVNYVVIKVGSNPDHSVDFLLAALDGWCRMIGLVPAFINRRTEEDGNRRWVDVFYYGNIRLGRWWMMCRDRLDEIKASRDE